MLGYVTAEKAELKMREYEVYSAYYCGLCKSAGKRYGQIPRLALSYDFAFLALLLSSLCADADRIAPEHCLVHPIKKKNVARENSCIDYAADMMLLLSYYHLQDDAKDEGAFWSAAAAGIFHQFIKKVSGNYDKINLCVRERLAELSQLEQDRCSSLDRTGETFAAIMTALFTGCPREEVQRQKEVLAHLGRYLGKWIYLADAWDDLEKDIAHRVYNPLLYRFAREEQESPQDFRLRTRSNIEYNLLTCLSEVGKAFDLLDIQKHRGILENIIYLGLLRKTEQLLKKGIAETE